MDRTKGKYIFLNGEIVPAQDAKISVFDHGFLYGDGLFETMRSYRGRVFRLHRHLARLRRGAALLQIAMPWSDDELVAAVEGTLAANGLDRDRDGYLRLSISRGEGPVGIDPRPCKEPTLVITARELAGHGPDAYEKGIRAIICRTRRNHPAALPPAIKSFNFLNNILAKQEVIAAGAAEGIMLNQEDYLTEGTVSNIFFVRRGVLYTPAVDAGILPGITREAVLELARELAGGAASVITGHREAILSQVEEGLYFPADLSDADEIFLTNSSWEIMPVNILNGSTVGQGRIGPVTAELLNLYRRQVVKELL